MLGRDTSEALFLLLAERVGFAYILQAARAQACARLRIPRAEPARALLLSASRGKQKGLPFGSPFLATGGEGGIRTHGTVTRTPDFESGTFDHSATSPYSVRCGRCKRGRIIAKVWWLWEGERCSGCKFFWGCLRAELKTLEGWAQVRKGKSELRPPKRTAKSRKAIQAPCGRMGVGFAHVPRAAVARVRATLRIPHARPAGALLLSARK